MKSKFMLFILCCCTTMLAAADEPLRSFPWPTELEYEFLPKRKIEMVNGVVKNTDARALPDIDEKYSSELRVDGRLFTLPFEVCEKFVACYRADLNCDGVQDYVFVHVVGLNGRFTGYCKVLVYISLPGGRHDRLLFGAMHLEAVMEEGRPMLVKYDWSDDDITLIRQVYEFDAKGRMRLHKAEAAPVWK